MNPIIINVPYPISTNAYKGIRVAGKIPMMYVKKEGIEFKNICSNLAKKAGALAPLDNMFELNIIVYPKLPKDWIKREKKNSLWYLELRTLDLDNCLKVLLDSFNGVVYVDDKKIFKLTVERGYPIENGGAKVVFSEYKVNI